MSNAGSVRVTPSEGRVCLECGGKTKRVAPATVEALVHRRVRAALTTTEGFRFCPAPGCDVVYSRVADREAVRVADMSVEVFQKSKRPDRRVCYCFDHRVTDVRADVGPRRILADIEQKCRAGLDRCTTENPQGRCCLGNVRKIYTEATDGTVARQAENDMHDCCANADNATESSAADPRATSEPPPTVRGTASGGGRGADTGRWAAGGAVIAALASSACCWLPLSLIALGASAGGVGVFFEDYRFFFLGGAAGLLGLGFYLVYLRGPTCAPGDACAMPNRRIIRINKMLLWVSAAFVVTFALFPNYIGYLLGVGDDISAKAAELPPTGAAAGLLTRSYAIEGMSCESCTMGIERSIGAVAGVSAVSVVFDDAEARVTFAANGGASDASIVAAIADAGFEAHVLRQGGE